MPWTALLGLALLLGLGLRRRIGRGALIGCALLGVLGVSASAEASTVCLTGGCDYTSISEALLNDMPGETIVVYPGTYFESGMILQQNRVLRSRDNDPATVTIDGGGAGQILRAFGTSLIEGITFRNGDTTTANGGAIGGSGDVFIRNCVFRNNRGLRGGAVALGAGAVRDSTFETNRAVDGGAISGSDILVERCVFLGNVAEEGGAVTADGGAIHAAQGDLTVRNSRFEGNIARAFRANGGAISLISASPVTCLLENVTMNGNRVEATSRGRGGGLYNSGCFTSVTGGDISSNVVMGSTAVGGGIYVGSPEPVSLSGTTISGNSTTGTGGGVYCASSGNPPRPGGLVSGNTPDDFDNCTLCTASEPCTTGLSAACMGGTRQCLASGAWGECLPTITPAPREAMCMDMSDDDCDGAVDAADAECMPPVNDTSADLPASGCEGDPVNTFTGELFERFEPDLDLGGIIPVRFERYYASRLLANAVPSALGDNWRHGYEWDLVDGGGPVDVITPRGRTLRFAADGTLQGTADVRYQLVEWGEGWLLGDPSTQRVLRFDALGHLVEIVDGNGNALTLTYAGDDLTSVSDGRGRTLTLTYGTNGRVARVTDGTRNVDFFYTGTDLVRVDDVRGNDTTFTYAAGSLMTTWTPPSGVTRLTMTYDAMGRVATQTDAAGHSLTFAYDPVTGVTTATDGAGDRVRHTHDPAGALSASEAEDTTVEDTAYDNDARLVGVTDRLGNASSRTYDPLSGRVASVTRADGTTLSHRYASRLVLGAVFWDRVETTYPDGTTRRWTYDAGGNLLTYEDRRAQTWTYTYDARGRRLTETNPEGGVTTLTWNPDDTLASRVDHAGNETLFAYDAQRRLSTVTYADLSTRAFTYDAADNVLGTTDGRGNTASATYDANGNVATTTDRVGGTTTFEYDAMDRFVATVDPGMQRRPITRDVEGRVTGLTTGNGATWTFAFDARGWVSSRTNGTGDRWDLAWNAVGGLSSVTDPLGGVTARTRDARQRLTNLTTAEGRSLAYTYDSDGRPIATTPSAGPVSSRTFDAEGRVVGYDEGGLTSGFSRDGSGRIDEMVDSLGSRRPRVVDPQGRVTAIDDPLGNRTSYAHDNRNRVSTITFPGSLGTLSVGYDANGNPLSRTYSDGTSFSYTWDAEDRLTGADGITLSYDANGHVVETNGVTISRDGFGRMTGVTYATGRTVSYTYDAAGRLSTVTDWIGGTTTFNYDAAGRLVALDRPNGVRTTYSRDMDGEVAMIVHGTHGSITLTRDAGGRITQAIRAPDPLLTMDPGDLDLTYDAASQVTMRTYDAMGRLTADGADTYTWNLASRLTAHAGVSYAYDARGMMTSRSVAGVTTDFVWSYAHALPSPVIERRGGSDTAYNVFTPGGALLYRVDASTDTRVFHHFDEVGHTATLTDEMGVVVASYAYGPYGELLAETGAVDNPFRWQGRYGVMRDPGSGLSYVRARWFDHEAARFLSRDQLSLARPRLANPYAYSGRDPLHAVDVDGRRPTLAGRPMLTDEEHSRRLSGILRDTIRALEEFRSVPAAPYSWQRPRRGYVSYRLEAESADFEERRLNASLEDAARLFLEPEAVVQSEERPSFVGGGLRYFVATPQEIADRQAEEERLEREEECEFEDFYRQQQRESIERQNERLRQRHPEWFREPEPEVDSDAVIHELGDIVVLA